MERKDYLALVHREACIFLDAHEAELAAAAADPERRPEIDDAIQEQLKGALADIDCPEDVLKWSGLREPDPAFWREADTWPQAVIGAALAALACDVRTCALLVAEGKLPRLRNVQVK